MNNEKNEPKLKVFYPSFKLERKTKAFNKYVWGFVGLISMVTVTLLMVCHAFLCDFLNLVSTFVQDYFIIAVLAPVVVLLILAYQMEQWVVSLTTSYRFEDGKIIRGRMQNPDKYMNMNIKAKDLFIDTSLISGILGSLGATSNINTTNSIIGLQRMIRMIKMNTNPEFVQSCFDTELYKKQEYKNPELVKTTKYSLIYKCDDKKKLVIPKIYEGMFEVEETKEQSFISRTIKRAVIVFIIAIIVAIVDLSIGYVKNNEYMKMISNVQNNIENRFYNYGYMVEKNNEKMYTFSKEAADGKRTSTATYYFDKRGNVKQVDIDTYYDEDSEKVEEELRYIISTVNYKFDETEVTEFVKAVNENIKGEFKYNKLTSSGEEYSLRIDKSGGFVHISGYKQ